MTRKDHWNVRISLLRCKACGRHALGLEGPDGGARVSSHKCAGAWTAVEEFAVTLPREELDRCDLPDGSSIHERTSPRRVQEAPR